jgi:hypothetical protein
LIGLFNTALHHSEETLIDLFALPRHQRPFFELNAFKVVRNPAQKPEQLRMKELASLLEKAPHEALDLLLGEDRWDVVITGDARPLPPSNDESEDEDEDDPEVETATVKGVDERTFKTVWLWAKHDRPRLVLTRAGLLLETRLARYLLRFPTHDYQDSVKTARRLLNVFCFGRHHNIRGGNGLATKTGEEIRRRLAEEQDCGAGSSTFNDSLHRSWRMGLVGLTLHDGEEHLLHRSLPNLPWCVPSSLSLCLPPFLSSAPQLLLPPSYVSPLTSHFPGFRRKSSSFFTGSSPPIPSERPETSIDSSLKRDMKRRGVRRLSTSISLAPSRTRQQLPLRTTMSYSERKSRAALTTTPP